MFDGTIENPLAMVLLALSLVIAAPAALAAIFTAREPTPSLWSAWALAALALVWLVLAPLNVLNHALGEPMVSVFGREAEDTGFVEYATVLLFAFSALAFGRLALSGGPIQRVLAGLGAVAAFFIAGEEISWGQWLFHWSTPDAISAGNLQHETNLHNFLPPVVWENAYALGGWVIIAVVLAMRFIPLSNRITFPMLTVMRDSRYAPVLALGAGVLMQHEFFQEISELALGAAGAYALTWVLLGQVVRQARSLAPA